MTTGPDCLVSRANSTPATAPTTICAASPVGPRAPKMPTVPSTLLKIVNNVKSAAAPATPKTITRKPVKRATAPAIKNPMSNAMEVTME